MFSAARFEFATASQIRFGAGVVNEIGSAASGMGKRALVAAGFHGQALDRVTGLLAAAGVDCVHFPVSGEPTVSLVLQGIRAAQEAGCDMLIGLGGGSALDTAKAIAALQTNPGDPLDYLEVVGKGLPLHHPPAPWIAIPTTAGTGSEVTRNAVLTVPEKRVKVSLRSPLMLARAAFVDPELTYSLPSDVTASTGMDALAQVIEPYVSRRANLLTDLYCREGIECGSHALLKAYQNGSDPAAREDMAFTSLMGGLALANAGLGAVHGFAGVVGGMFDAPHGAVCAALLPPVVKVNTHALAEREPGSPALVRYIEISRLVTGRSGATYADLIEWLKQLRNDLNIPSLSAYGVTASDLPVLVEKSAAASSMKANPLTLTPEELREILEMAL